MFSLSQLQNLAFTAHVLSAQIHLKIALSRQMTSKSARHFLNVLSIFLQSFKI
jgi:hypothetical protein